MKSRLKYFNYLEHLTHFLFAFMLGLIVCEVQGTLKCVSQQNFLHDNSMSYTIWEVITGINKVIRDYNRKKILLQRPFIARSEGLSALIKFIKCFYVYYKILKWEGNFPQESSKFYLISLFWNVICEVTGATRSNSELHAWRVLDGICERYKWRC